MLRRRIRPPGGDDSATADGREGEEGALLLKRSGVGWLLATSGAAPAVTVEATLDVSETVRIDFRFRMEIALDGKRFC